MKLRLRGNSIRIRLTQSEVKALAETGAWEESVAFDPSASHRLVYRVEAALVARPSVEMSGHGTGTLVRATLPVADVVKWARGADVGMYFEEPWGLKVAIEKDFRCLDGDRNEDESDNFDNPNAAGSLHTNCDAD